MIREILEINLSHLKKIKKDKRNFYKKPIVKLFTKIQARKTSALLVPLKCYRKLKKFKSHISYN